MNKAIDGLVQACRCWNMKLTDDLKMLGFEQSHANPYVFRKFVTGELVAMLAVHVDDILALTTTKEFMEAFVGDLCSKYKIKDLREASYYVGYYITRNREKKEMKFDQHLCA